MDDLLREFLVESHEHLDRMEADLVALEAAPGDEEALARVFRAVHTIKGTCGFFGMPRLEALAHAGENVLTRLLGGDLAFSAAVAGVLLRFVDAVRSILATIEKTGKEGTPDAAALVRDLEEAAAGHAPAEAAAPEPPPDEAAETPRGPRSVRLDVSVLDELMAGVGELVLSRNQILEASEKRRDPALGRAAQHLSRITGELQESVMRARMEPVGRAWARVPRLVRDLAALFGKQVRVTMKGGETELDRTILEAIADPLTHIVRNSLDHGIERPDTRKATGKPATGRLALSAYQEGGHVVIEIRDDGAGIDPERVRAAAVKKGLRTREEAAALSDADATRLVFLPGFSTAREVTPVSGRGVGMDVVRTNVEGVGGTVDLVSAPGKGTTMRILLPLTLAILPALVVSAGGQRFVVPQSYLRELVLVQERERGVRIARVQDAPVLRLRGRLLPLLHLDEQLRLAGRGTPRAGSASIVVLDLEDRRFGLVVDRILDTQETVVKRLGPPLDGIPVYAGATILGDGSIALIVDVPGLAEAAGILDEQGATWQEEPPAPEEKRERFLLVQAPDDGRAVVPLGAIARLEEFPARAIERAGRHEVLQYRGRILPLLRVSDLLAERRTRKRKPEVLDTEAERKSVQIAVLGDGGVGLVIDRILDIVDLAPEAQSPGSRDGVKGTMIVQGRVAELLDVEGLLRMAGGVGGAGGPRGRA
ncbi:MAG TPA: chemotaxis protein CheW [Planctomycetota bacterium]|nr:chemotaxis protein CheW [Planctomycetota bacterium]